MSIFSNKFRVSGRSFAYGSRMRPMRDWFVLLILFFVLMLGSVIWNVVQFSRVADGQQIGAQSASIPSAIKLDTVQALFMQRAQERIKYQSEYRFVDPSL